MVHVTRGCVRDGRVQVDVSRQHPRHRDAVIDAAEPQSFEIGLGRRCHERGGIPRGIRKPGRGIVVGYDEEGGSLRRGRHLPDVHHQSGLARDEVRTVRAVLAHKRAAGVRIDPERSHSLILYVSPRADAHQHRNRTFRDLLLWEAVFDTSRKQIQECSRSQCGNEYSYVGLHNF